MTRYFFQNLLPLPAGASAALVKPTKYHYYPHNQHIYLLPECAIQQVMKLTRKKLFDLLTIYYKSSRVINISVIPNVFIIYGNEKDDLIR